MVKDTMENDKKTQVIASDPVAPPPAPSPPRNGNTSFVAMPDDCPPECPQEDHVKVDDEAHEDVDDDTKSDSSELEYFNLDSDHLTTPIESLDDYGPGGFYPVHLGDTLGPLSNPSRFRVLHKLGRGGYGTVWLYRDTKDSKPKALKILSTNASEKAAKECPDLKALQLFTRANSYDTNLSPQAHTIAEDLLKYTNG